MPKRGTRRRREEGEGGKLERDPRVRAARAARTRRHAERGQPTVRQELRRRGAREGVRARGRAGVCGSGLGQRASKEAD